MSYDYFYGQSGELFSYFRIPKALFQDSRFRQLSTDARTLYGILLDRMSLSAKNGWLDEQERVYIIYTVREVRESLCCAEHKAVKLFRELEQADLIERKRRGLGRPSLIYVKNFSSGSPKVQNCANSKSCVAENTVQVQPKPQSNKTKKNKTDWNNPFFPDETDRLTQREQLEGYFYQALEVELLLRLCPDDEDTIYQIVDLLVDTCSTKRKMLRIAGDDKPAEVVCSRLKKLNADHIRFVLNCLAENTSPVRNMKQYLQAVMNMIPINRKFLRGDIYYANLEPHLGSEQGGIRPVVVVQNNTANCYSPNLIVAPVTSNIGKKPDHQSHVLVDGNRAFVQPSMILAESVQTISKGRLIRPMGRLSIPELIRLNYALLYQLDLNEWVWRKEAYERYLRYRR